MEQIRKLTQDENGIYAEIYFPLFDTYIMTEAENGISTQYVEHCAESLQQLSDRTIHDICKYALDFCRDTMSYTPDGNYPEQLKHIHDPQEILPFFEPTALTIDEPQNPDIPALNLYCHCVWDQDNDMQILILGGEVVYVGVFDGLNAWQDNLGEWGNYVTGYRL
ncbi:DUF6985 domain-containing protein [Paenibacillus sp. Z6-24]